MVLQSQKKKTADMFENSKGAIPFTDNWMCITTVFKRCR
uniref:Uncharacterized protein n=1 Tax=Anguilla anguilla TaxID=7936 RepID=A0A0E9RGV8_ANGAN